MTLQHGDWNDHRHEAVRHGHRHFHVTHNFIERVGAFEHLGFAHDHDHEHGPETHQHYPHQDTDAEHLGEAHAHDHPTPASSEGLTNPPAEKPPAKKTPPRKATSPSTPRKTASKKTAAPRD